MSSTGEGMKPLKRGRAGSNALCARSATEAPLIREGQPSGCPMSWSLWPPISGRCYRLVGWKVCFYAA